MKICLTFSAGGHFTEMRKMMDAFEGQEIFFVTIKTKSTEKLHDVYYLKDTMGPTKIHMILNMIIVALKSIQIIIKEKPNLIISTGADVTIPICYIAKIFKTKVIFVESICRVIDLSTAGKIILPIADLFLVQWENLTRKYQKTKYWGQVI